MKTLFKADLYRIFKDSTCKAMLIVVGVLSLVIPFLVIAYDHLDLYVTPANYYSNANVVSLFNFVSKVFPLMVTLFASILIYKDFNTGNIRNKILAGYDRKTIYFTSFLEHLLICVVTSVSAILVSTLFSCLGLPLVQSFDESNYIYVLRMLAVVVLEVANSFFITSLAVFFTMGLKNLPLGILSVLFVLILGLQIESFKYYFNDGDFMYSFTELINFYLERWIQINPNTEFELFHLICYFIFPLAFGALFGFLGYKCFKTKDFR